MAFDLESHIGKWTNYVANKSTIGRMISSPIWFSVIMVCIIILITYVVGWSGAPTFKLVFYMLCASFGMIIIHDNLYKSQISEKYDTSSGDSMVSDIAALKNSSDIDNVRPRPAADATKSFMRTNVDSQSIETADDLLGLVDLD